MTWSLFFLLLSQEALCQRETSDAFYTRMRQFQFESVIEKFGFRDFIEGIGSTCYNELPSSYVVHFQVLVDSSGMISDGPMHLDFPYSTHMVLHDLHEVENQFHVLASKYNEWATQVDKHKRLISGNHHLIYQMCRVKDFSASRLLTNAKPNLEINVRISREMADIEIGGQEHTKISIPFDELGIVSARDYISYKPIIIDQVTLERFSRDFSGFMVEDKIYRNLINLISNHYLEHLQGKIVRINFEFDDAITPFKLEDQFQNSENHHFHYSYMKCMTEEIGALDIKH